MSRKLNDYARINYKLTVPEILDKKGNDLRIQLFQEFRKHQFGGTAGRKAPISWQELKRRTQAGIGTIVRDRQLNSRWGSAPSVSASGRKLTLWQKLLWQETIRRQSGIGVLATSFLEKRWRSNNARGPYLVNNVSKTLGVLMTIQKSDTEFRITGYTPGLDVIAQRYGIPDRAFGAVIADLDVYLSRKLSEAWRAANIG